MNKKDVKYSINYKDLKKYAEVLGFSIIEVFKYSLADLKERRDYALKQSNVNVEEINNAYNTLYDFYCNTRGEVIGEKIESKQKLEVIEMFNYILKNTSNNYENYPKINEKVVEIQDFLKDMINRYNRDEDLTNMQNYFNENYIKLVREFVDIYFSLLDIKNNYKYTKILNEVKDNLSDGTILDYTLDYLVLELNNEIVELYYSKKGNLQSK